MTAGEIQVITFFEFKDMTAVGELATLRTSFRELMKELTLRGTMILSNEGYNSTICGRPADLTVFLIQAERILHTRIVFKSSFHKEMPFRRIKVKIKPEIVTLRKPVDLSLGRGTHVPPAEWNRIIGDPGTIVLDARNGYEVRTGTFPNAVDPRTEKFNDLPAFVARHLDPQVHKRVAMFCTGGIRCEKFAPYMKGLGFEEIFQLEGGILKYLEDTPPEESLWQGECFVFDERISLDSDLRKGTAADLSQPDANEDLAS